jgi:hypothetical protein
MMSVGLSFPAEVYRRLLEHMSESEDEQVAFLFSEPFAAGEPLRMSELYAVPPEGFNLQSPIHVTLADHVRGQVIGRAAQLGGCLVEAHSHGGDYPAAFSGSDLSGFDEWVPHVRWRLKGRPYVALVFAEDSFDALVWEEGSKEAGPLGGLIVDGRGTFAPTGITVSRSHRRRRGR